MNKATSVISRYFAVVAVGLFVMMPRVLHAQILDVGILRDETNLPLSSFMDVLTNIMKWALAIVSVLSVLGFVIAGILYLTAAGDEDAIARARRAFVGAIFGVIVSLLGLIVLQAMQTVLSGESAVF